MELKLINGTSGRMKYCLDDMTRYDGRRILIVPDQASYASERTAVAYFGGTGFNGVEVLTFNRMGDRLLKSTADKRLSKAGKNMLILRAVGAAFETCTHENKPNTFLASMKRRGFAESITAVLSEFRRYGVSPEELLATADDISDTGLSEKLTSLYDIYFEYDNLLGADFIDSDDDLLRLGAAVAEGEYTGARVWISGFTDFLPGHMAVLSALIETAASVTVVLPLPDGEIPSGSIYASAEKAYLSVIELAEKLKCSFSTASLPPESADARDESLLFFKNNWDFRGTQAYTGKSAIEIIEAADPYAEFDSCAEKITELIMSGEYRYSDISVICGNLDNVRHIAEAVFADYDIPYFSDYKITLAEHPAVLPVLALFDIIDNNYSFDSVFRYLRSGYVFIKNERGHVVEISNDDVDMLENYVLRRGLRGRSAWAGDKHWDIEFERVFDSATDESGKSVHIAEDNETSTDFYDDLRKTVVAPIEKFRKSAKGGGTMRELAAAIYEFLCDIYLYDGIKAEIRRLEDEGETNEAARLARIWELLCETLDQAVLTMGDLQVSLSEFAEYIKAGFSGSEISVIPTGIDRVSLTPPERGIGADIRAVFVLGANFGVIPASASEEGILTDRDRMELEERGMRLAPDTVTNADQINSRVMFAMMSATEKLYVYYTLSDASGADLEPSPIIAELRQMFSDIEIKSSDTEYLPISTPSATVHKLLINHNKQNALWRAAADWYRENGYAELIGVIDEAARFEKRGAKIYNLDNYSKLYKSRVYSISGLESFAKCPFKYFLNRGIKAKPREEWEVSGADFGTLAHAVIERFCRETDGDSTTAAERRKRWLSQTDEEADALLENIITDIAERSEKNAAGNENRVRYIVWKIRRILDRSIRVIRMSITEGQYAPAAYEYEYNMKMADGIKMRGFIDRLDIYEHAGDADFRVMDYKTGSTASYNFLDVYNGVSLQLAVYALAAEYSYSHDSEFPLKEQKNAKPLTRGVFYNKIRNDYSKSGSGLPKLEGMIFADSDDADELDTRAVTDMDAGLAESSDSAFLPVRINKKDRRIAKSSTSVESVRHGEMLKEWVKKEIEDDDAKIRAGVIDAEPFERASGARACDEYCDYAEACVFKRRAMCPRKAETDTEAAWTDMKDNFERRRVYKNEDNSKNKEGGNT